MFFESGFFGVSGYRFVSCCDHFLCYSSYFLRRAGSGFNNLVVLWL